MRFWEDVWVGNSLLCGGLESSMDGEQTSCKVSELWQQGVGWSWGEIGHLLPASRLVEIASVMLRPEDEALDAFEWKLGRSGCMMKSAYMLCKNRVDDVFWPGWWRVWRAKTQQRVKIFAWMFARRRILTNAERQKRHLTSNDACVHCSCGVEDELHTIRDCCVAKEVWDVIIPVDKA